MSYWIVSDKDPIISLSHIKSKDVKDVLNKAVAPVAVLATGIYALFCNIINFSVPQAELSISLNTVDLLGIVFGKPEETKWADWLNSNKIPSAMISEDLLIGITVLMGISVFAVCWMALWGILSSKSEGRVSKYTYVAGIGLVIPCVVGLITNSMVGKEVDKYLLDYGDGLLTPEQLRKMGNITQSTDMWIPFVIGALICAVAFVVTNLDKIKARLGNVQAPQHKPESKEMETIEAIAGYKKLLDDGIITEEEFAEKKSELLNQK
ncbi:MAG: SHOCT domain-containing protein [Clostridia bacterium]|nr:SHOCT domain-containing protein [Clostridia bacterium]